MEGTIGEIRLFAGNFAPRNWALCEGQLLSISQNSALFSVLGTIYGGDGRTTFGLPELRGRVPVGEGRGPGLSNYSVGQRGGVEHVNLTLSQIPEHSHNIGAQTEGGEEASPAGQVFAEAGEDIYSHSPNQVMQMTGSTGGGDAHENHMPYIAMKYIICTQGLYPSRS